MRADTAAKEKKDLGIFYLKNPNISPSKVFPKDMPDKICTNFTCKGKDCANANCDFTHPHKASELKRETILAIASYFEKKDIGWFNEYHMKMPEMTAKVKRLLSNTNKYILRHKKWIIKISLFAYVHLFTIDTRLWIGLPPKGGSTHLNGFGFVQSSS